MGTEMEYDDGIRIIEREPEATKKPKRGTKADLHARLGALNIALPDNTPVKELKARLDAAEKVDYTRQVQEQNVPVTESEQHHECKWCGTTEHRTVLNDRIKEQHGIEVYFCARPKECDERRVAKGGTLDD